MIYYLEKESVEQTLDFVVDNSAKGSKLAFDYFTPEVIDGTTTDPLGKKFKKAVIKQGEPLKFGIATQDIEDLLEKHRFTDVQKYSAIDIRNTYFHGNNKKREVSHLFNFVCSTT